jgi:hypothetical protein
MVSMIERVGRTPTIDIATFFEAVNGEMRTNKLTAALGFAGCTSWDEAGRYIQGPSVSMAGIGGIPISKELLDLYRDNGRDIMAASAGMSYLNSGNKQLSDLYKTVIGQGHFSIAHTTVANILVAGVTSGVENEFNSQRDLIHLSRVTNARTAIQDKPPIVVPSIDFLPVTRRVVEATDAELAELPAPTSLDEREARNLLYPSAKATLFLATASLRNFQKLVAQAKDTGKEREYQTALSAINLCLSTIWPELFSEDDA